MANELDPTGAEPRAILNAANLGSARILEIGSGDGRLTFRYAAQARSVVGVDLKETEMIQAVRTCPADLRSRVQFLRASATRLPFRNEAFDIVLLASSL